MVYPMTVPMRIMNMMMEKLLPRKLAHWSTALERKG